MEFETLRGIIRNVIISATRVGEYIHIQSSKIQQSDIEFKGKNDLVSFVDKEAEKKLVHDLSHYLPNSGFLTEEETVEQINKEYTWIIDPLDGTTNYLNGIPTYAISVALMHHKEVIGAVVYELGRKEMFHALKGGGAFLNDSPIKVNASKDLGEVLVATGFPYTNFGNMKNFMSQLTYFIENSRGVRRIGSAAVDLAYTACGRFGMFFEQGLAPWDVAAGTLLVTEAGGQVSDFSNNDNYIFGGEILASNGLIHKKGSEVFKADVKVKS
jgi:myo-inositol-1(or 4)-monophosphatase